MAASDLRPKALSFFPVVPALAAVLLCAACASTGKGVVATGHTLSPDGSRMLVHVKKEGRKSLEIMDTGSERLYGLSDRSFTGGNWVDDTDVLYATARDGTMHRIMLHQASLGDVQQITLKLKTRNGIVDFPKGGKFLTFPSSKYPFFLIHLPAQNNNLYRCELRNADLLQYLCFYHMRGSNTIDDIYDWIIRENRTVSGIFRALPSGQYVLEKHTSGGAWKAIHTFDQPSLAFRTIGLADQSNRVWAISNRDRDRISLVRLDMDTGEEIVHFQDDQFDLWTAVIAKYKNSSKPIIATSAPGYQTIHYLDLDKKNVIEALLKDAGQPAELTIISTTGDGKLSTIRVTNKDFAAINYLVDFQANTYKRISTVDWARVFRGIPMPEPVTIQASDGRNIFGYLTLPANYSARNPPPMIVTVHGGPWERYYWSRSNMMHWVAKKGYAVLNLNYRGSWGYNRDYLAAGFGEVFGAILRDISDSVEWAYGNGYAERGKVALVGGSFGGFLALEMLGRYRDLFAAAVVVNSPTDAGVFWGKEWRRSPVARRKWREYFFTGMEVGDEFPREYFLAKSPLKTYERIETPLLLVAGARDERVPVRHTRRLYNALKVSGKDVEVQEYPNLGHGIASGGLMVGGAVLERIWEFVDKHLRN